MNQRAIFVTKIYYFFNDLFIYHVNNNPMQGVKGVIPSKSLSSDLFTLGCAHSRSSVGKCASVVFHLGRDYDCSLGTEHPAVAL